MVHTQQTVQFSRLIALFLALLWGTSAIAQTDHLIARRAALASSITHGQSEKDLNELMLVSEYTSKHNGIHHFFFQQNHLGIPVENAFITVHLDEMQTVRYLTNQAISDLKDKASGGQPIGDSPQAGAQLLWRKTADSLLGLEWKVYAQPEESFTFFGEPHTHKPETGQEPTAKPMLPALPPAAGMYKAFPFGTDRPDLVARQDYPVGTAATGSPFGWHDTLGTPGHDFTLAFSNSYAPIDPTQFPNLPMVLSIDGGGPMDFDFPLPAGDDTSPYLSAMYVNMHYQMNVMHDLTYRLGFDEAAGNFQFNNYGLGGLGGDPMYVYIDTTSGFGGGNFSVMVDGSKIGMSTLGNYGPNGVNFGMRFPMVDQLEIEITSPAWLARSIQLWRSNSTDTFPNLTLTGNLVVADDGSTFPGQGCGPLLNAAAINGNIVLFDSLGCSDSVKIASATAAGATGCIICTEAMGSNYLAADYAYNNFDTTGVTIPVAYMHEWDCKKLLEHRAVAKQVRFHNNTHVYDRNTGLDMGVVMHEVMHNISERLVNGPAQVDCILMNGKTREGWCDWFGLWTGIQPGDNGTDPVGFGSYSWYRQPNGSSARGLPFTTNMEINHLTHADIISGYRLGDWHQPSIFTNALWDMTWALIDNHGFDSTLTSTTAGNMVALQLVLDGLALLPCTSDYLDARDAILQADTLTYGGTYSCEIWYAFARRGFGWSASQGASRALVGDNVAAFDNPPLGCGLLPVAETQLFAEGKGDHIELDWRLTQIESSGTAQLMRRAENEIAFSPIANFSIHQEGGADLTCWSDHKATPGIRYDYQIFLTDPAGEVSYSNIATAQLTLELPLQMNAYPNPTKGVFEVEIFGGNPGPRQLHIIDVMGREVYRCGLFDERKSQQTLDLSHLPQGPYFLIAQQGNQTVHSKILLQR